MEKNKIENNEGYILIESAGIAELPGKSKECFLQALAEVKSKNYGAAVNIYKNLITDCQDSIAFHNNLGCCFAATGKYEEAESEFIEAVRLVRESREKRKYIPRPYILISRNNLIKLYKTILSDKGEVLERIVPERKPFAARIGFTTREILAILRAVRRKGLKAALSKIPLYLSLKCNNLIGWYDKVLMARAVEFDLKYNLDTAGIVYQYEIPMDNENQQHATYYQGTDSLFFNNAMSSLKIDFKDFTFIDFGSGKGKALFLASFYPFEKIIGIEFSEALNRIALENIRKFNKPNIESYCIDAVDYNIPRKNLVCYFYDPFNENIMEKVIENISKAYKECGRDIVIVYGNPRFSNLFDAQDWLERRNHVGPYMRWLPKRENHSPTGESGSKNPK